ncbi:hypothetical protein [Profundibacterium mesophilum]|uniref:LPS export ABC transporter periplasmic protein LptC n=1 Tax=Profundibacterium mesophilum KAUST100406-0324 TaxID=1037889 RepID=A0A921NX67_9RHOB|nr:hypothetical protein [Profundibacterium mesophilum]KAF0676389.1 hypothetical protein PMES_01120 [Profundibacterium mesophilum KAUST100406-0324]
MRHHDNGYSRLIAWLKIALPLAALGILSTLFLVAEQRGSRSELPYSDVDIERFLREQRIGNPNYAGLTADGSAITLSADSALPGAPSGAVRTSELIGVLETPDGGRIDLSSSSGRIDPESDSARLGGGVVLRSSTGYRITAEAFTAALGRTHLRSEGPVRASGPAGTLEAGGMELAPSGARYVLSFTDGVRLVYRPASLEETDP